MLIYQVISHMAIFVLILLARFKPSIQKAIDVRKNWEEKAGSLGKSCNRPVIFHCASLGEFDQAIPLIQKIKAHDPEIPMIISFYSPSGYEKIAQKNPELNLLYLPFDTQKNAQKWVSLLNPRLVLFARYEFWPNLLNELRKNNTPYIFFSSVFRKEMSLFHPVMRFLRELVLSARILFVQDEASLTFLRRFKNTRALQAGDTRVDRVLKNIAKGCNDPILNEWAKGKRIMILGSVHKEDLWAVNTIIPWCIEQKWQLLLAPHDVDDSSINWWFQKTTSDNMGKWSESAVHYPILVLDTIGILATSYVLGSAAYIGGGFGTGIHNTLEPASAGLPISFGPKYSKFVEASMLISRGAAFPVQDVFDLNTWLGQLKNEKDRAAAGKSARIYIEQQQGAAEKIMSYLVNESIIA